MRHVLRSLVILLLLSVAALPQDGKLNVGPDLKAGADYVWLLAQKAKNSDRPSDDLALDDDLRADMPIKNAVIDLDEEAVNRLPGIIKAITAFDKRSPLEPSVGIIDNRWIDRILGNQIVTYRLQSKRGDALFLDIHMMGKTKLSLTDVKLVSAEEVINRTNKRILEIDMTSP